MRFCSNCGAVLAVAPDPSSLETLSLSANPQTSPTNWPSLGESFKQPTTPVAVGQKSRAGLIVGILAAVLLLGVIAIGGGVGYYYYSKSGGDKANDNQGVYTPASDDDNENANVNAKPSPAASVSPTAAPSPGNAQLFEPPTEPTKEGTFTVYANGDWQLSQIAVVPLEEFTTTVQGIVDLAGAKAGVGPGGVKDAQYKARRLFQEWPAGALLMRTRYANGSFSNTVATSAGGASGSWQNLPDERGMLEFRINDNAQQNNGGQFTIRARLTKVPKSKK
jgi:hypothetical protein